MLIALLVATALEVLVLSPVAPANTARTLPLPAPHAQQDHQVRPVLPPVRSAYLELVQTPAILLVRHALLEHLVLVVLPVKHVLRANIVAPAQAPALLV